jgi:hypothetical protein
MMHRLFPSAPVEEERFLERLERSERSERLGRQYDGGRNNCNVNTNPRYRNNNSRGGYGPRYSQRNNTNRPAAFD